MPTVGPPDLDELLTALHSSRIPVGPGELTRLHHAFKSAPALDRKGLHDLLSCLLVKNRDQRELCASRGGVAGWSRYVWWSAVEVELS